ncbi:hypothetical protein D7X33_09655 [Butyricicoccus sp. 1XD8-22]|nr:hypothetical protein D7X33_09655 [Butyricicoccus sp. 1XD8-22]
MKLLVNFFSKKLRVQPVGHYPYSRAVRGSIECGRALPLPGEGRVSKGQRPLAPAAEAIREKKFP